MRKLISTLTLGAFLGFAGLATTGTSAPQVGWGLSELCGSGEITTKASEAGYGAIGAMVGAAAGPAGIVAGAMLGAL